MLDHGVDVLLLSVGADLPYLTGYEAMPLERLTMLVLPREGEAELSSAVTPDDATAIGLHVGTRTFIAPLRSRAVGANAMLDPQTNQEEDT